MVKTGKARNGRGGEGEWCYAGRGSGLEDMEQEMRWSKVGVSLSCIVETMTRSWLSWYTNKEEGYILDITDPGDERAPQCGVRRRRLGPVQESEQ